MDNPLSNVYTDRDFQYLKSKSLDVCIVVRQRGTKEVTMRSSVPHSEAVKMIRGMENTKEDTWVTEAQKNRFPKSPEPLEDILNCKPKIQKLASKLDGGAPLSKMNDAFTFVVRQVVEKMPQIRVVPCRAPTHLIFTQSFQAQSEQTCVFLSKDLSFNAQF